jgi:hypothetical protein
MDDGFGLALSAILLVCFVAVFVLLALIVIQNCGEKVILRYILKIARKANWKNTAAVLLTAACVCLGIWYTGCEAYALVCAKILFVVALLWRLSFLKHGGFDRILFIMWLCLAAVIYLCVTQS